MTKEADVPIDDDVTRQPNSLRADVPTPETHAWRFGSVPLACTPETPCLSHQPTPGASEAGERLLCIACGAPENAPCHQAESFKHLFIPPRPAPSPKPDAEALLEECEAVLERVYGFTEHESGCPAFVSRPCDCGRDAADAAAVNTLAKLAARRSRG